jgi:hypothetical protein
MSEMRTLAASPQPWRTLELANRISRARSELRTAIADGRVSAADIILICPSEIGSLRIVELLSGRHGWREIRSRTSLAQLAVREDKMIKSLTGPERRAIASLLAETVACAEPCSPPVP